jgi:N6-L-threonylcarbamoyladenine synthase
MNILGIETSCDETSVSIISNGELKSNLISSQDFHIKYGGVVPELSSRAHLQMVLPLLRNALKKAGIKLEDLDVLCATAGPGLIGALLVGLNFAKGLSVSLEKPFVPVNHIEGLIFSGFLMPEKPIFPFLSLVVSGGHTLLLLVKSDIEIIKLGSTIDDAAGEAFDKVSKMLGLEYPGGPNIQKLAEKYEGIPVNFPVAKLKTKYDFSFSGLKTAVLRYIQEQYNQNIPENALPLIAFSFQKAAVSALVQNCEKALEKYDVKSLSLVGGVAANSYLRSQLNSLAGKYNKEFIVPDISYCGDNAAMIAYRGMKLYESGFRYSLDYNAFARLPETFQPGS